MQWHLIIEEYGPELKYLPGHKNIVADALSHLPTDKTKTPEDHFPLDKEDIPEDIIPITYSTIAKYQKLDKQLQEKALNNSRYSLDTFSGGGKK